MSCNIISGCKTLGLRAWSWFSKYDSPRMLRIRDKKVWIASWFIWLVIIAVSLGYFFIWTKGYEKYDYVESAVTTRIKETAVINFNNVVGFDMWDVVDKVVPPQEDETFFVMTNAAVTSEQTLRTCDEDPSVKGAMCNETKPCRAGEQDVGGNGVMTGKCINSTVKPGVQVCEITAWCPVERNDIIDTYPEPALGKLENFTVTIDNYIEFPQFKVRRRNIHDDATSDYLETCLYNPGHDTDCPVFTLGTITSLARHPFQTMAKKGGVIQIVITWNCDLIFESEKDCRPKYSFRRLKRGDFNTYKGFSFRHVDHYKFDNGTRARTLYRVFGIRFIITVQGRAIKISLRFLFFGIAGCLVYLAHTQMITDGFMLCCLPCRCCAPNRAIRYQQKFVNIEEQVVKEGNPRQAAGENQV